MPIIQTIKDYKTPQESLMNLYPDQFNSSKEKEKPDWVKVNLDYFYTVAINQFTKNNKTFVPNYDLVKGILKKQDFYEEPETRTFTETLEKDLDLPAYVKNYTIMNPPLNTLVGEMTKRPDNSRVKAFDEDSQSEELAFRTELLNKYIFQLVKQKVYAKLEEQGVDIATEEGQQIEEQMTAEELQDKLSSYTSQAEKWANHILETLKVEFNLKEKSEDSFRDLLISAREFYHIFENKSKLGFGVEVANPKNVWHLTVPDKKYTRESYAAGTIEIMEISDIINTFDLTEKEIIHLREKTQAYLIDVRESNLLNTRAVGIGSVNYDTYDPLVLQTRMLAESQLKQNVDELHNFLGISNNVGVFGQKFVVVRAYWLSKKKIGKLVYIDETGAEQTTLVDETYKEIPEQVSIEWGWINQWYQGIKIGPDIYYAKPLEILDYCPIIGVVHEMKNSQPRSLVDLMKPYQMIYNVCMNQLWRLLEKEIGVAYKVQLKRIPTPKDADDQDALDIWELQAREKGILFEDESPESMSLPNTAVSQAVDLSRTNEIKSRYELAATIKNECWELVGLSRQRLGGTTSSETATAINTALTQSYAQTEPYFTQHEYVNNQLYQAIIDAALYVESNKPDSTVAYINSEDKNAFVKVNGTDLKFRDLKVFVTSRAEDQRFFQELRGLAQPMLQNGATPYEIATLYDTNSVRRMKEIFKSLKDKRDKFAEQQAQAEQQASQAELQQKQAELEFNMKKHQDEMMMKKYEIDTKANIERDKLIQAPSESNSLNPSDILNSNLKTQEINARNINESNRLQLELAKEQLKSNIDQQQIALGEKELQVRREEMKSKEKIAASKPKPKSK